MATNRFLKAQNEAVSLAFDLGRAYEQTPSISDYCTPATLLGPEDARTAISSLGIDPVIHSTLCCPKCFSLHLPDIAKCMMKVSNLLFLTREWSLTLERGGR